MRPAVHRAEIGGLAMYGNIARHLTFAFLLVAAFDISDAGFVVRAQQCPPGSSVIIDPRLVPRRPRITQEAYVEGMVSTMPDWWKHQLHQQYMDQNPNPIRQGQCHRKCG